MLRHAARLFLLTVFLAVASAASARTEQFRPEKFFAGHTCSTGIFRNTFGKPERFTTDCHGRVRGDTLLLDQKFTYDDGHVQSRHWQIRRVDEHHYVGHANDVVGEAQGEISGSDFHFHYTVALSPTNPLLDVQLKQTMTLRPDGTAENRATIKKLGALLSRVQERFHRVH